MSANNLTAARESGDAEAINSAATDLALRLARMHLLGNATSGERRGWNIRDTDRDLPLDEMLRTAVANDTLDTFFALMRPAHPQYSALMAAYELEEDPEHQATIARNMERWRWMPRSLGEDYVLVNAAKFEADLWRDGSHVGTWRVIVGTQRTPTPVFRATIEGVILNPWWEIPTSIVRESVGALVRNNPSLARSRGYVVQNGRYRQRPGPNNALGQMKLVMPNPYSVYMHDTPNRQLFEQDVRSFSHGCIRTGDAIGFATTLLEGVATREDVDAILETGRTTTLSIAQPTPVYVTYFTAVANADGSVALLDDLYGRDRTIRAITKGGETKAAAPAAPQGGQRRSLMDCRN
ncbi:L,D-transpeptidase family protein [Aurantiacibacter sp. MUD11]|uniref:L,D-transpeptidase family protein n=1 Tax=Aurantiacibacter sp. MUD11 TaxID=3003265 RepID=UPI003FA4CF6C